MSLLGRLSVAAMHRLGVFAHLRAAWRADLTSAREKKPRVRAENTAITNRLEALELTVRMNEDHRPLAARLSEWTSGHTLQQHARDVVARARIDTSPMPHALIEGLFPDDFYRLLLETFPPAPLFGDASAIKHNLKPEAIGPTVSRQLWTFIEKDVTRNTLGPELATKFRPFLHAHCQAEFGPTHGDRIAQLPLETSAHRLMLRRSGYRLDPHLDPKHVFLTCLIYLARSGDSEEWGTQLFKLADPAASNDSFEQARVHLGRTVYPKQHGIGCTLAKHVPFLPNSALVFVNSGGAHGVELPSSSEATLERYAYQFYVGQSRVELQALTSGSKDARHSH